MSRRWILLGMQGTLILTSLFTVGCNGLSHRKFWGGKDGERKPGLSQTVRPTKEVEKEEETEHTGWKAPITDAAFALDAELNEHPTALASAIEPAADSTAVSQASAIPASAQVFGTVLPISGNDFEREVLESDAPVLVDFYASWCGPCKKMAPVLDQFAAETPNVKVVKVDIEEAPRIAKKYDVKSVPTLLVFKSGEVTAEHNRLATRKKMDEMIAQ
jgi:thioredoxin 1